MLAYTVRRLFMALPVMGVVALKVLLNLIIDLSYTIVDPRIRY